jgi:hypothetical protein
LLELGSIDTVRPEDSCVGIKDQDSLDLRRELGQQFLEGAGLSAVATAPQAMNGSTLEPCPGVITRSIVDDPHPLPTVPHPLQKPLKFSSWIVN